MTNKIKITEAIAFLEQLQPRRPDPGIRLRHWRAIYLGVEALKRLKNLREKGCEEAYPKLPGER